MSLDLYIVLSRGLPKISALAKRLADRGGAEGTWKAGVRLGEVEVTLADEAAPRLATMLAKAKKAVTVDRVLQVTAGDFEDVEDIAEILLADGGGALVSESGAVLLSRAGPKKTTAPTPKQVAKRSRLDTSIPPEVLAMLGGTQAHYEVHPRDEPKTSLRALMKAVPIAIPDVEYGSSGSPWAKIGKVLLSRPRHAFRTSFDPWTVDQVDADVWLATLHLACGLARRTRGVVRRRIDDERDVRFDFAPSAPLPATVPFTVEPCEHFAGVTYTRPQEGFGDMVGMGQKLALRWHIPGATEPAEIKVVLGAAKTNPALAVLHGEQVGTTLRIDVAEPRGLASRVPPCADGRRATLEVSILRLLR